MTAASRTTSLAYEQELRVDDVHPAPIVSLSATGECATGSEAKPCARVAGCGSTVRNQTALPAFFDLCEVFVLKKGNESLWGSGQRGTDQPDGR